MLRTLPINGRQFWKPTMAEQSSQKVQDRQNYYSRELAGNEVTAMALNEIAATACRGYFFYLPLRTVLARQNWSEQKRRPAVPTPSYPSLVFMDMMWDPQLQTAFAGDSQRGRYLRCNFLMNPPNALIPVYGIQYVQSMNSEVFSAGGEMTLFATPTVYHLVDDSTLNTILSPARDNKDRLTVPRHLWRASELSTGKATTQQRKVQESAELARYAHSTLRDVYDSIIQSCTGPQRHLITRRSASDILQLLPRAAAISAHSIGTNLGQGGSTEARTRRGERRPPRRKAGSESDDVGEDEEQSGSKRCKRSRKGAMELEADEEGEDVGRN